MAKVYAGIVTYNSLSDLPACLDGLRGQTYSALEVTALDNGSVDGSAEWLRREAQEVRLIESAENLGYAAAHNRIIAGCGLAQGDYYLPLNPDVTLQPGYIEALVQTLEHTRAGWGTGRLWLPRDGEERRLYSVGHAIRRDGYAVNIGYGLRDDGRFDSSREVFGAPGAAPLIAAALIADLAPDGRLFDEDMGMYAEDTDLDWRARLRGWRCWYAADAGAWHRGSSPGWEMEAQTAANRYLSVIKNAYVADLALYNVWIMAAHCAARLAVSPAFGMRLATRLVRMAPRFWRKRRAPKIGRDEMLRWFTWSREQPSAQPGAFASRIAAGLEGRGKH